MYKLNVKKSDSSCKSNKKKKELNLEIKTQFHSDVDFEPLSNKQTKTNCRERKRIYAVIVAFLRRKKKYNKIIRFVRFDVQTNRRNEISVIASSYRTVSRKI